jgi:peptidoglycan/LPS O-acetylase OafA/YrhL
MVGQTGRAKVDPRRLCGLDGLRGVAVTAVVLFHSGIHLVRGGLLGVDIFFVLSGYLITGLLLDEWRRTRTLSLRGFWERRARRLLPALFAVLAVVTLVWQRAGSPDDVQTVRGDALATLLYVANWHSVLAAHGYFTLFAAPSPLLHTWSLAVEEQFYLVWPLVAWLVLTRLRSARVLVWAAALGACASAGAMVGLSLAGLGADRLYYGTDTRVQALLVGAALVTGLHLSGRDLAGHRFGVEGGPLGAPEPATELGGWPRRALSMAGVLAAGLLTWMCTSVDGRSAWLYRGGFLLVAVAVAVVITAIVLMPYGPLARGLTVLPLVALGRVSYGLYLWHWPVIVLLDEDRTGLAGWRLTAGRLVAILAVSALSYHLLERPIRERRWRTPRPWFAVPALTAALVVALVATPLPSGPSLRSAFDAADAAPPASPVHRQPVGAGTSGPHTSAHYSGPVRDQRLAAPGSVPVTGGQVLAIGDSIMLDLATSLRRVLPGVRTDGVVGRQWDTAPGVLARHRAAGFFPVVLIVELGTNGPVTPAEFNAVMRAATGIRWVVFVTVREPRPWQNQVNATLRASVPRFPHALLADWFTRSAGHGADWFYTDDVHPVGAGLRAYADLLLTTIRAVSPATHVSPAAPRNGSRSRATAAVVPPGSRRPGPRR